MADQMKSATVVANFTSLEGQGPQFVNASKLRARASRYRILAKCLFDPRAIATAESCARELEAEAELIETKRSRTARWTLSPYRADSA